MNVLLKSATIIAPTEPVFHQKKRDILIKNGSIFSIATAIAAEKGVKELELPNLHVSIGWFDTGVCFGEPGHEERETIANGLEVAAKSGFTDILLNPNTTPTPDTSSALVFLKERAKGMASNLHPIGNLTVKGQGRDLAELFDMQNAGAVGFYDHKKSIANANLLKMGLLYAQNFDGVVCSFPEDGTMKGKGIVNEGVVSTKLGLKGIPNLAEELQVARDLYILNYTGGKLHIPTISTANAVKLIADAKKKGLDVSCSVAIHNLLLTDELLVDFDANHKVSPPLRTEKDSKALLKGIRNGTIDFVTSDHIPIDIEEKRLEFDNATDGTIGLESAFGVLNQQLSLDETVLLLTKGRDRFGLSIPLIKEGEKACLTLFEPDSEGVFDKSQVSSASGNSIFYGQKTKGKVYGIINNNQLKLTDGNR